MLKIEFFDRYKAWIDIYLTNGKIISSNAIEFTTKDGPINTDINKIDTSGQFIHVFIINQMKSNESKCLLNSLFIQ